jgi:hypothetical protein
MIKQEEIEKYIIAKHKQRLIATTNQKPLVIMLYVIHR